VLRRPFEPTYIFAVVSGLPDLVMFSLLPRVTFYQLRQSTFLAVIDDDRLGGLWLR